MSHFTKIRTKIVEKEYLLRALDDLDYAYEEEDVKIRGFGRQRQQVDIKVKTRGYDVGFRKVGDNYEIVADWWGVRGTNRKKFVQQVTQRYAYHAARAKLEERGFTLASEDVQEDGRIHLVLRRMV
ncbi:MAG: DUF1257 domain-containing protein [Chloroflexi bacterium]|nr:DUF1257 domain-containing protein [Chloroflexota bacterium]